MVTLELKEFECELFKTQVFDNMNAIVLEFIYNYTEHLDDCGKLEVMRTLSRTLGDLLIGLHIGHLKNIKTTIGGSDMQKFLDLADERVPKDPRTFASKVTNKLNLCSKVISPLIDCLKKIYSIYDNNTLEKLRQAYIKFQVIVSGMKSIPAYKFIYINFNDERNVYLEHVVCAPNVCLRVSNAVEYGELICSKLYKKEMRALIEKYTAMADIADSIRQQEMEREMSNLSFF